MAEKELIVLIPHYNNIDGLKDSLLSINEKIKVDIVVVDDGSLITPNIEELKSIYTYGRVFLRKLESNKGIQYALNHGLEYIQSLGYTYIARLDCGDYCHKNRFQKQLKHLKQNEDIKLLGTQVNFISKEKVILYKSNLPLSYNELSKAFYVNCKIIHPTVMFCTEIISKIGFYPTNFEAAEDYAFFFNILKVYKAENLDQVLVDVVVDHNGISVKKRNKQIWSKIKIISSHFYFGASPIFGILRNFVILLIPFKIAMFIKGKVFSK